jgi:hypothetical protein
MRPDAAKPNGKPIRPPAMLPEAQSEFNRVNVVLGNAGEGNVMGVQLSAEQMSLAESIVSKYEGAVLEPGMVSLALDQSCVQPYHYIRCDPPLRGGVEMSFGCTTGFRVMSNSDRSQYILTAGHCGRQCGGLCPQVGSNPTVGTHFMSGSYHLIGKKQRQLTNAADASTVRIDNPSGWGDPSTIVVVLDDAFGNYAHRNESFSINAAHLGDQDDLPANNFLCHTGMTIGTTCGPFAGTDSNSQFRRVKYCAESGDSGRPVYVRGFGFGLHIGRFPGDLPCPAEVGGYSYYQILSTALSGLNVHLIP